MLTFLSPDPYRPGLGQGLLRFTRNDISINAFVLEVDAQDADVNSCRATTSGSTDFMANAILSSFFLELGKLLTDVNGFSVPPPTLML
jgi:hypothetical protein